MFASIRKYQGDPAQTAELMHRVDSTFADRLEHEPGFIAYHAIDCGDGLIYSVTVCRDEAAAERSAELAAEFVSEELSDVKLDRLEVTSGAILVSRAESGVLEPAHA
jgi:hypothetical protein